MPPHSGFIYAVVSLFGIGILFTVFIVVFSSYLVPAFTNIINDDNINDIDADTRVTIIDAYANYMMFFKLLPFVLFFAVIIYMVVLAVRREKEEEVVL